MKPDKKSQAERREVAEGKLLSAAIKLIVQKGYDRFTLASVGDAAGYSRGLPAHYFGRKEDLLSEVARYLVDSYNDRQSAVQTTERGLPRLMDMILSYSEGTGTTGNRALNVLIFEAAFHPKLKATITRLNTRGAKSLFDEISAGQEAGNIRPDIDAKAQAAVIYAFLRGQMSFAALDPKFDIAGTTAEFMETLKDRLVPVGSTKPKSRPAKSQA